jgi:hypothetical protein
MGIKVKRSNTLKKFPAELKKAVANRMGVFAADIIEEIQNRTANQGIDAYGKAFDKYSKGYQAYKSRKNKLSLLRPDLTLSGHMLQSLISEVVSVRGKVIAKIFSSSNDGNKRIEWNMNIRKFFLISKSQKRDFQKLLDEIIRGIK